MSKPFELVCPFSPAGDQPQAIEKLVEGIESGLAFQTLLGVTGSGKTFTLANTIAKLNKPTLILAPKAHADARRPCVPPRTQFVSPSTSIRSQGSFLAGGQAPPIHRGDEVRGRASSMPSRGKNIKLKKSYTQLVKKQYNAEFFYHQINRRLR